MQLDLETRFGLLSLFENRALSITSRKPNCRYLPLRIPTTR